MLTGVRVLDFTRVLAGPLCTMHLGDLGADVIKVERTGSGDATRGWGPPFAADGQSAYFLSVNRNKQSLAVDLNGAADRDLLSNLLNDARVVVDNFRPGTLERAGLPMEQWLAARGDRVWCTITGFGENSGRPGYDVIVQAESGWMAITGEPDGAPMKVGVALADVIAGKDAAIGILGALAGSAARDRGAHVIVSLMHSAIAALVNVAQNVIVAGPPARRWGNSHPSLVPYQLFDSADRPIVLAVGTDGQWAACADALGLHELASDPVLADNAGRVRQRDRVVHAVATVLLTRNSAYWLETLAKSGVPCGVVKTVEEALSSVPHSTTHGVASPIPGVLRYFPPRLDEHGATIRRLGWGTFL